MKINLRVMMAKRKLTITQLSEMTGISKLSIRKFYNDESKAIRFESIEAFCQALDCEISDLLKLDKEEI